MTDAQKEQFDKFGCVSRCIIKLTEWHKKPITAADFVARFYSRYPHWVEACGLLSLSDIIDVCRELELCRHANTYRDLKVVRGIMQEQMSSGVFLLSERDFVSGSEQIFHCSLIHSIYDRVRVWSPCHNQVDLDDYLEDGFEDKSLAHFLVLRFHR